MDRNALASLRLRHETVTALSAVEAALEIAAKGVSADLIRSKGSRDLVTPADVDAEDAIRQRLMIFGYPVVGEERGGTPPDDGSPYWLVDPICGTTNYAAGLPLYCVNLALVERGQPACSVVGDASRNELCVAETGRGAWAIRAAEITRLGVSERYPVVVVEEVKPQEPRRAQVAAFMAAVMSSDRWDFRSLSTTLGLAYLAAGRIAAYIAFRGTAVHGSAGALLVKEAGGTVTDIGGEAWTIDSDSLVSAATPELHANLREFIRATEPS